MKLAIFDLDSTLIAGDSDFLWGQYLSRLGHLDGKHHRAEQARFYRDYQEGTLDVDAFLAFQLRPLAEHEMSTLRHWRDDFMHRCIQPIILPKAQSLVHSHRLKGHRLLLATATNRFITEPIAAQFSIPDLIATEPEIEDGQFTGRVSGTPAYATGKLSRLQDWLQERGETLEESWFYSDSHTDIPLLQWVDHAVAVDPDSRLHAVARQEGWEVRSLRAGFAHAETESEPASDQ